MNEIEKSNSFKRLQEYRIDFAYSKGQFYEAVNRLNREKENYIKLKKIIDTLILIFTLLTFIAIVGSDILPNQNIIVGISALIAFGLSIYQFIDKNSFENIKEYQNTADNYLDLYKKAKNIEVKVKDNLITLKELDKFIDELHNRQIEVIKNSPKTIYEDYKNAKNAIEKNQSGYSENDFKNT